ncbi:MAG: hypothetical protein ABIP46_11045 [Polaromonas sp.]
MIVHQLFTSSSSPKMWARVAAILILGFGYFSISNGQALQNPIASAATRSHAMPMAIYKDIKIDDLSRLLIDSFSEFNFSLLAAKKSADGSTVFQFSYPIYKNGSVIFEFNVDGTIVNKKCMNCFLRWGELQGEKAIEKLPWMAQYDLSSRLYPDIDKAYSSIQNKSLNYMDRQYGFDYKSMWSGERNRAGYDNSYVGVRVSNLKRELVRAFTDSGFVLLSDSNPATDASDSVLRFSFPIGSDKPDGVVYAIQLASQFDANGLCFPCESQVRYDPYQTLPPAGLSAMAGRLALASRFEAGLNNAYDQIKASTERYLRPRTQFVRPPKFAPPGSPRPALRPPVVT